MGIISYNETLFKRLLGLDVFTTDFIKMGETAASMIINEEKGEIKNKFRFVHITFIAVVSLREQLPLK